MFALGVIGRSQWKTDLAQFKMTFSIDEVTIGQVYFHSFSGVIRLHF